ncbi:MAG: universal stress protein [Acidobacteria bacterium]|nr:universal stress protein [Acidobacteriota bacterium]
MKILLATDGTKHGTAAAEMVMKLCLGAGDSIHLISVVDMAVPMSIDIYGGYLPDTTELEKSAKENAAKVIAETAETLKAHFGSSGVVITGDVLFGSPDSRIVETAEETGTDMIVMGSHGYKRWERLLLGSVSNSVVHHAHCSVLVVRTPDAE